MNFMSFSNYLEKKKIHAGDGKLNKLRVFYPVLSIIRDELERHLEYFIEKDIVIITEMVTKFHE